MAASDQTVSSLPISAAKLLLLEKWKKGTSAKKQTIPKRMTSGPAPLSFAQQRLWFLDQLVPENTAYNVSFSTRLCGTLNLEALQAAFDNIIRRQEALRTVFRSQEGTAYQFIEEPFQLRIAQTDLRHRAAAEQQTIIDRITSQEVNKPFDLAQLPLLRITLLRLAEDEYVMLGVAHHIVFDGWSAGVFQQEFFEGYRAFSSGLRPALSEIIVQYPDFAEWQRKELEATKLQLQLEYWKSRMSGEIPVLQLPTDKPRPLVYSFKGAGFEFAFQDEVAASVRQLCDGAGITSFMLVLAALNVWLHKYYGQEDILIGCPIANRTFRELEGLIGNFANTLVLRTDLSGDPSFRELLRRVQLSTLEAYENQDLPFERLVNELHLERDMSRNPLFQVMLNFDTVRSGPENELAGLKMLPITPPQSTSKFDLWLTIAELPNGLRGKLEYSTDLFTDGTAQRMVGHLKHVLQQLVREPDQPISKIALITAAEFREVVYSWNETGVDYELGLGLHHLVEAQVQKSPLAPACIFEGSPLSYEELNCRANRLAHYLRGHGVGQDSIVGVACYRSLEMVIALLGVLKAGGAYLPMDPDYPPDRLKFMVEDSNVKIILVQPATADRFAGNELSLVSVESITGDASLEASNLREPVEPDQLAYAIYTSGSTGNPKAGLNAHRGICNRLLWMQEAYQLTANDRVLQKTSFSFDVSVWEFFWPLITGSCIVLARPEGHKDPQYLAQLIQEQEVTTMHFVPSMLRLFLEVDSLEQCTSVRQVICSGEALPQELAAKFSTRLPGVPLYNLYGPTEAAIDVTAWRSGSDTGSTVPIGRPIANIQTYVLDQQMLPVPVGVAAELYLGGIGVGRGYLNRPSLTADKFVPDPFSKTPGMRLYRTGDLVRWLPAGALEFLDRIDSQVKIKGYRIELGEIETQIRSHPSVQDTAVVTSESDNGEKQLVAYVVAAGAPESIDQGLNSEHVQEWRKVFNHTYNGSASISEVDDRFDFSGWTSSYTGDAIDRHEMEEWLAETVNRILQLKPKSVLELGCGTGLILLSVAPKCDRYVGTDISERGLHHIASVINGKPEYNGVKVRHLAAHEIMSEEARSFDVVVLNSIVQYFPNAEYLTRVLQSAVQMVRDGGSIFIGDVRNLGLLEAFHASLQASKSPALAPAEKIWQRSLAQKQQESELVIDPAFFHALPQNVPDVSHAEVWLKRGLNGNELTKFRFDVVLKVRHAQPATITMPWTSWRGANMDLDRLRQQLTVEQSLIVALSGIVNARTEKEMQIADALANCAEPSITLEEACNTASNRLRGGINPEALWRLGEELGYKVRAGLRPQDKPNEFSVIMERTGLADGSAATFAGPHEDSGPAAQSPPQYTNNPLQHKAAQALAGELRRHVREKLPDFMTPAHFVMLETLPLTTSGKLDRKALPRPANVPRHNSELVLPQTPLQEFLLGAWREVLGMEAISIEDNFFELGGDSIASIRVVAAAQKSGLKISVQQMFKHQTIQELADAIEHSSDALTTPDLEATAASQPDSTPLEQPGVAVHAVDFPLAGLNRSDMEKYLPGAEIEDVYPLGGLPEEMLVQRLFIGDPAINMVQRVDLEKGIDANLYVRIFQMLIERHPILRTSFLWKGLEKPLQVVHKTAPVMVEWADWRGCSEMEQKSKINDYMESDARRGMDLSQAPQFHVCMARVGEKDFITIMSLNYMCLEGWSMYLLKYEHAAMYEALVRGETPKLKPAISYRDYIVWLRNQSLAGAQKYWQSEFRGAVLPTPLIHQFPENQPSPGTAFTRKKIVVPSAVTEKLRSLTRSHHLTESIIYQTAWAFLLSRYSKLPDVVFGLAMTGRSIDFVGIEELIGPTLNFLPVRVRIADDENVMSCVLRLQENLLERLQFEHSPLQKIRSWLGFSREALIFQSVFYFQNLEGAVHDGSMGWFSAKTAMPLRIDVYPRSTELGTEVNFSHHLKYFDDATVFRIMNDYKAMLAAIAEDPFRKAKDLTESIHQSPAIVTRNSNS